jgi:hypothetical protein
MGSTSRNWSISWRQPAIGAPRRRTEVAILRHKLTFRGFSQKHPLWPGGDFIPDPDDFVASLLAKARRSRSLRAQDSFAIAIRGLFAWLPLSICMNAVLRYLPIGLIFRLPGRLLPGAAAPKRSATSCADDGPDKENADRVPLRSLLRLQHQSAKIRQQRLGD